MKTIIKSTVKIGPMMVKTKEAKNPTVEDKDCAGTYDYCTGEILIKSCLPKIRKEETWVHEVFHAITMDRSISISEAKVAQISSGIYCFLKDNGYIK